MTLAQTKLAQIKGAAPFQALKNEFGYLQQFADLNKRLAEAALISIDRFLFLPENVASKIDESEAKVASLESVACGNVSDVRSLLIKHSPEFADELARATSGGDRP